MILYNEFANGEIVCFVISKNEGSNFCFSCEEDIEVLLIEVCFEIVGGKFGIGVVVIEEAGGKVTDIDGNRLDFSCGRTLVKNRGIVGTNGVLHERVLEAVKRNVS